MPETIGHVIGPLGEKLALDRLPPANVGPCAERPKSWRQFVAGFRPSRKPCALCPCDGGDHQLAGCSPAQRNWRAAGQRPITMRSRNKTLRHPLRAVLAALLFCTTSPALASDWRLSAIRLTRYGTSLAFVDVSSVSGGHGQVSFTGSTFFDHRTGSMNRVIAKVTANCSAMSYRFDEIVSLYNQRLLHRQVGYPAATAVPGTNIFDEISSVCGIKGLGMHVENPETFAAHFFGKRAAS